MIGGSGVKILELKLRRTALRYPVSDHGHLCSIIHIRSACSSGGHAARLGTLSMTKRYTLLRLLRLLRISGLDDRIERTSMAVGRLIGARSHTENRRAAIARGLETGQRETSRSR